MLTEANYAEAISILKYSFGNKLQIVTHIMNINAVISTHNVHQKPEGARCDSRNIIMEAY